MTCFHEHQDISEKECTLNGKKLLSKEAFFLLEKTLL